MVSPFILPCFPFSVIYEHKGTESLKNHRRGVDKVYGFYLLHHANGQMHKMLMYLIASSVKIIAKRVFTLY